MADDTAPLAVVIDCETGAYQAGPLAGDDLTSYEDYMTAAQQAAAQEAQALADRQAKVAQAQQIMLQYPNLQVVLDALGLSLA